MMQHTMISLFFYSFHLFLANVDVHTSFSLLFSLSSPPFLPNITNIKHQHLPYFFSQRSEASNEIDTKREKTKRHFIIRINNSPSHERSLASLFVAVGSRIINNLNDEFKLTVERERMFNVHKFPKKHHKLTLNFIKL